MSIRMEDLPLPYQERAAKQIMAQMRKATGRTMLQEQEQFRQKYNARRAECNNINFDSQAEMRRYQELMALFLAGQIQELKIHPEFTLIESYTKPDGERVRRMRYTADFSYLRDGVLVVEDVKSRPTQTTDYQMRKKIMLDRYGIVIQEIS